MGKLAATLLCLASPAFGDDFSCLLRDPLCPSGCQPVLVEFAINTSQFAPALDPGDPPRRQLARVTLNGTGMLAEAIMMEGGVRGFYAQPGDTQRRLLIMQDDGTARMVLRPEDRTLEGMCDHLPQP